MNQALSQFGFTTTNTNLFCSCLFTFCKSYVSAPITMCCGDNLLLSLVAVRSISLQLLYLSHAAGENGAAVGLFAPTAPNTKAVISGASQALRSDFDNAQGFSYLYSPGVVGADQLILIIHDAYAYHAYELLDVQ